MPPFPERESSILAILKKKSGRIPDISKTPRAANPHASERPQVGPIQPQSLQLAGEGTATVLQQAGERTATVTAAGW